MTDTDLDQAYTTLCHTMTRLGEPAAEIFLARVAVLAIARLGDLAAASELIESAADLEPDDVR